MMMLTPLDGQIAAPNQFFAQNGVFLGGIKSVYDKGGELVVQILFFEKRRHFFPLSSNARCSAFIFQKSYILSEL